MSPRLTVIRMAAIAVLTLYSLHATAADEKLENELRKLYEHQLLSLRSPYFGKTLSFDSSGIPNNGRVAGPWSTCGLLQAQRLRLSHDGLEIEGKRVILALRSEGNGQTATSTKLKIVPVLTDQSVRIRVQLLPLNVKQISETLAQVFQGGQLMDRVSAYWKPMTNDLRAFRQATPNAVVAELEGNRPVYLVNAGVIQPPRPIHAPDPEYPEAARLKRQQGTTVLSIVVNEKGFPEILEIVRGLGEGLDIEALLTVATWRFDPAIKDGKPVAVLINVEVAFRLS